MEGAFLPVEDEPLLVEDAVRMASPEMVRDDFAGSTASSSTEALRFLLSTSVSAALDSEAVCPEERASTREDKLSMGARSAASSACATGVASGLESEIPSKP